MKSPFTNYLHERFHANQHTKRTRRGNHFEPRVELLEDRCVPAVFTVNSNLINYAVDGLVTLSEAIAAANNNAPRGDAPAQRPVRL